MLAAVFFDWSNTLVHFEWDDERVAAGHRAALGHDDPSFTARWRELLLGGAHGHRPYGELLAELGVEDPDAFIDAEHDAWRGATTVLADARALLESLRARGVRTALVANAWPDPGRVLRSDAAALGLAPLFDTIVTSEDVGARKPAPEPFLRACAEVGVEPDDVLHVGDDVRVDVQGAADLGMTTVQAMWFHVDDKPAPVEPDFLAFTAIDVLNIARRLA